jgi:SRSO17 transposase
MEKGECCLSDYQGRRWDGLHRHLALSMLAYSFLMLHSSVTTGAGSSSSGEAFPPSVRHTTLPAIHRQVLMWLLENLVLWYIETDRIKSFRPRRN